MNREKNTCPRHSLITTTNLKSSANSHKLKCYNIMKISQKNNSFITYKNIFSYLRCFLKYTRKYFHKNQCHAQLIHAKNDTNKHLQMLKPIMAPIN